MSDSVHSIGFSVDLMQMLLWQYNDAPALQILLAKKQEWYDKNQTGFWNDWVRDVFDLRTANEFGLAVWSIILDLPLVAQLQPSPPGKIGWGFGPYRKNFENGNFNNATAQSVFLTVEQRRLALRLRYFQLVSRGTVPETNRFLRDVFAPLGRVYVLDGLDMTQDIVFTFRPPPAVTFVLNQFDLLPRPSGVKSSFVITTRTAWGFGSAHKNFDHGNFAGGLLS